MVDEHVDREALQRRSPRADVLLEGVDGLGPLCQGGLVAAAWTASLLSLEAKLDDSQSASMRESRSCSSEVAEAVPLKGEVAKPSVVRKPCRRFTDGSCDAHHIEATGTISQGPAMCLAKSLSASVESPPRRANAAMPSVQGASALADLAHALQAEASCSEVTLCASTIASRLPNLGTTGTVESIHKRPESVARNFSPRHLSCTTRRKRRAWPFLEDHGSGRACSRASKIVIVAGACMALCSHAVTATLPHMEIFLVLELILRVAACYVAMTRLLA